MKNTLIVVLIVLISLALTYHFKAPPLAALFFAAMVSPFVVSAFYPSLLFIRRPVKRPAPRKPTTLRLHPDLTTLADGIAFAIASGNEGGAEGVVYAHAKGESILKAPEAILAVWQIQSGQLVRVAEQVYRIAHDAPSVLDPDAQTEARRAKATFTFMLTAVSADQVEAEISHLYTMGLHPKSRGGNAVLAHFDKMEDGLWKQHIVQSLLNWD